MAIPESVKNMRVEDLNALAKRGKLKIIVKNGIISAIKHKGLYEI